MSVPRARKYEVSTMKEIVTKLGHALSEDEHGWLFERNGQVFRLTRTLVLQREAVPHVFVRVEDPELQDAVRLAVAA